MNFLFQDDLHAAKVVPHWSGLAVFGLALLFRLNRYSICVVTESLDIESLKSLESFAFE